MISKGKTYRTCDNHEVRIYATDGTGSTQIHGAIYKPFYDSPTAEKDFMEWCLTCWNSNGKHIRESYNLIEVKPRHKRTVWVTVWNNGYTETSNKPEWRNGSPGCGQEPIACIKVDLDFEEGEGL